jgi:hypothetical protein
VGMVSEFAMNAVVNRIMNTYQLLRPLDPDPQNYAIHRKPDLYDQIDAVGWLYGIAYLKERHDGRDPRFTGCKNPRSLSGCVRTRRCEDAQLAIAANTLDHAVECGVLSVD